MDERPQVDWEGHPREIHEWMRKQVLPVSIFMHESRGEVWYALGKHPSFLYEKASKYTKEVNGIVYFDQEKIRKDFCIPIGDISVASFVKHKIAKIVEDFKYRWGILEYEADFGHAIDAYWDDEEDNQDTSNKEVD